MIVPSNAEGDMGLGIRVIVGEIEGCILFENPFDDEVDIDISDFSRLECGDPWNRPYVGVPYNLRGTDSEICFYKDVNSRNSESPPTQDDELIRKLRQVRRLGAVRFIVNPYGIVLTKRPPEGAWVSEEKLVPVYVGRIDYNCWFEKEEV